MHLNVCVLIILLTKADNFKSNQEQKIRQHINKTVFVGETVTLYCNKTIFDETIAWKINNTVIFSYSSYDNTIMRNFSSNRIDIDTKNPRELKVPQIQASDAGNYICYPEAIRWTLTIRENRPTVDPKQMPLFIIIIISCSGVILVCLMISISICTYRKWRKSKDSNYIETGQDLTPSRGRIQTHTSQYFERYNSIYGQIS